MSDQPVQIPGLPAGLRWHGAPVAWSSGPGTLAIEAGPRTDRFVDPRGDGVFENAPALLMPAAGDWQVRAWVEPGFRATYDAGVLFVRETSNAWAKLCFERSPQGQPMVVSVVTRAWSDDCNAFPVNGSRVALRVARLGPAYAFHASLDGATWSLTRHFRLGGAPCDVGFLAQSPTGEGCRVAFDGIAFHPTLLGDLRDGS